MGIAESSIPNVAAGHGLLLLHENQADHSNLRLIVFVRVAT